jgi:hypothetical protein
MIRMSVNVDALVDLQRRLALRAIPSSAARAATRTAGNARKAAAKRLREDNHKQQIFMKAMKVVKAKPGAVSFAGVSVGRSINLSELKFDITEIQTSRGLRLGVRVNIAGQQIIVPGAFVARMRSGHEGIFIRKGRERLPIREMKAREVLGGREDWLIRHQAVRAAMIAACESAFPRNFKESFGEAVARARG